MKLSIVIPVHNEAASIAETVDCVYRLLQEEEIVHEFVVVNDRSTDGTAEVLNLLTAKIPTLLVYENEWPGGFGYAVRYGLEKFDGDCVAIMMADLSDDPADLVRFYREMVSSKVDCVFGSRFMKGSKLVDYPLHKLLLNRIANNIIRMVIGIRYNDTTNAFKLYKRETIDGLKPFLAPHFNLTIELALKSIVRGYSYKVLANAWYNRKTGVSKFQIREMGSRYFFILLYCFIEKFFSKGDYMKKVSERH
jgi:dolichol-phosphate mannosyltransferase